MPTDVFCRRMTIHGRRSVIGSRSIMTGQPKLQWNRHHIVPFSNHAARPHAASCRGRTYPRQHSSSPRMFVTNSGIHAANTKTRLPGSCRRNSGDTRKFGFTRNASSAIIADARAIPIRPRTAHLISSPLNRPTLSRWRSGVETARWQLPPGHCYAKDQHWKKHKGCPAQVPRKDG